MVRAGAVLGSDGEEDFAGLAVLVIGVHIAETAGNADTNVRLEGSAAGFRHSDGALGRVDAIDVDDLSRHSLAHLGLVGVGHKGTLII